MAKAIKRRRRRSRDEWRKVFARQMSSGLSVAAFCAREAISLSSFQRWRTRIATASGAPEAQTPARPEAFVDLGMLGSGGTSRLELKLDLGDGLVLHLVRG